MFASEIQVVGLRRFTVAACIAAIALWKPIACLFLFGSIDLLILVSVSGHTWRDSAVLLAAWFVGNGSLESKVPFPVLGCLMFAAFLGYVALGMTVWVLTIAATKGTSRV